MICHVHHYLSAFCFLLFLGYNIITYADIILLLIWLSGLPLFHLFTCLISTQASHHILKASPSFHVVFQLLFAAELSMVYMKRSWTFQRCKPIGFLQDQVVQAIWQHRILGHLLIGLFNRRPLFFQVTNSRKKHHQPTSANLQPATNINKLMISHYTNGIWINAFYDVRCNQKLLCPRLLMFIQVHPQRPKGIQPPDQHSTCRSSGATCHHQWVGSKESSPRGKTAGRSSRANWQSS